MFYCYRYSAPFCRRLALLLADGCRGMQVFEGEAFLDENFHHACEATLGELLVITVAARCAGLGHEREFLATHAAGEGFQPVGLGTAHIGTVVVELHEMRGLVGCRRRLTVLAVLQSALEVGVLLLRLSACVLCLVGLCLDFGSLALEGVHTVVERGDCALIAGTLRTGTARHEVVAHGGEGEDEVLRGDVLAVQQPVHLAFESDGEAAAHVGLDVERGRDVERVELLVAVLRLHIARDGDGTVVADARPSVSGVVCPSCVLVLLK